MLCFPVHQSDRQVIQLKTHITFVLFCAAEVPPLNTHCTIPYLEIGHYQCKNKLSLTSFNVLLKYSYFSTFYFGLLTSKIYVDIYLKVGLYGKNLLMQLKKYCYC